MSKNTSTGKEESKVLLMRNLTPEVTAAIERAKEHFDVNAGTKAAEIMLIRFWKLNENYRELEKKYNRLTQNVIYLKELDAQLSDLKMNRSHGISELFELV